MYIIHPEVMGFQTWRGAILRWKGIFLHSSFSNLSLEIMLISILLGITSSLSVRLSVLVELKLEAIVRVS